MRIGIFDSGIGGEAVAASLARSFPHSNIMTVNDRTHLPYGDKSIDEIQTLTDAAIQPLLNAHCDVIVIACNSATAAAIDWLRLRYPMQRFIGIEPMIKTAASLTKTDVIGVCATPATLHSERYASLKQRFGDAKQFIEPDCHDWARLIEMNRMNHVHIKKIVDQLLAAHADVIVLGCTHYHWIKDDIISLVPKTMHVLEPSASIATRIKTMLYSTAE